jgi:hypothetical protein
MAATGIEPPTSCFTSLRLVHYATQTHITLRHSTTHHVAKSIQGPVFSPCGGHIGLVVPTKNSMSVTGTTLYEPRRSVIHYYTCGCITLKPKKVNTRVSGSWPPLCPWNEKIEPPYEWCPFTASTWSYIVHEYSGRGWITDLQVTRRQAVTWKRAFKQTTLFNLTDVQDKRKSMATYPECYLLDYWVTQK